MICWARVLLFVLVSGFLGGCGAGVRAERPPSMNDLACPPSDTENSSTGLAAERRAETPVEALGVFAAEGFLSLDETRGTLRIVDRSNAQALAEYGVDGHIWALIHLRHGDGWYVDAVAWCGSAEH